jgi:hypothetical protein
LPQEHDRAGLLVAGEDIPSLRLRFRDQMFQLPTCGRVIAFGGRAPRKRTPRQSISTPETALPQGATLLQYRRRARWRGAPLMQSKAMST